MALFLGEKVFLKPKLKFLFIIEKNKKNNYNKFEK